MGGILGYARVSTGDQDVAGQTMRLEKAGAIKVFTDVMSGKSMDRPGLADLLAYATVLNQTSRNEWRKIEGRFEQLRFVEDSQELYGLAATVISERRPDGIRPPKEAVLRRVARGAIAALRIEPARRSDILRPRAVAHAVAGGTPRDRGVAGGAGSAREGPS